MAAVAALPHYTELLQKNKNNRSRLLAFEPARFMTQMKLWGDFLARAGDAQRFPVTGLDAALLSRIRHPALCIYVVDTGGKDDGMHTLSAMRALHDVLPGAADREVIVSHEKEVYARAIDSFAARMVAPSVPPPSPSFAAREAPLAVTPGMYSHMPDAAEVAQFKSYYEKVAADNAAEAERERNAACACNTARSWLSAWRMS